MNAQRKRSIRKITAVTAAVITVLFLAVFFYFVPFRKLLPAAKLRQREEGELRVHFLSLPNGECTLIEFPDGEIFMIDAGDGSTKSDNLVTGYLKGLKGEKLTVAASDGASIHVGGMASVFEMFSVERAYLPAFSATSGAYQRFTAAIAKQNCPYEKLHRYMSFSHASGAYLVVLSPYSEEEDGEEENAALIAYLSYQGVRIVLSYDVMQKRENLIVSEYGLTQDIFDCDGCEVNLDGVDVLRVSRHGAAAASSQNFVSLLSPATAIVCCNETHTPSGDALNTFRSNGSQIYRTDEAGNLCVSVKGGAVNVYSGFGQ